MKIPIKRAKNIKQSDIFYSEYKKHQASLMFLARLLYICKIL